MASPANEGGIGGKFRRRPLGRPPATPYDRPPAALRGGGGRFRESGGWISRLVDPASRLIASGASKLFSSVFQKRLTAPPSVPGSNEFFLRLNLGFWIWLVVFLLGRVRMVGTKKLLTD